jgi:hypothetical protein
MVIARDADVEEERLRVERAMSELEAEAERMITA